MVPQEILKKVFCEIIYCWLSDRLIKAKLASKLAVYIYSFLSQSLVCWWESVHPSRVLQLATSLPNSIVFKFSIFFTPDLSAIIMIDIFAAACNSDTQLQTDQVILARSVLCTNVRSWKGFGSLQNPSV